jgi:hypothetical protein
VPVVQWIRRIRSLTLMAGAHGKIIRPNGNLCAGNRRLQPVSGAIDAHSVAPTLNGEGRDRTREAVESHPPRQAADRHPLSHAERSGGTRLLCTVTGWTSLASLRIPIRSPSAGVHSHRPWPRRSSVATLAVNVRLKIVDVLVPIHVHVRSVVVLGANERVAGFATRPATSTSYGDPAAFGSERSQSCRTHVQKPRGCSQDAPIDDQCGVLGGRRLERRWR